MTNNMFILLRFNCFEWDSTGRRYKQQSEVNGEVDIATIVMPYVTKNMTKVIM